MQLDQSMAIQWLLLHIISNSFQESPLCLPVGKTNAYLRNITEQQLSIIINQNVME